MAHPVPYSRLLEAKVRRTRRTALFWPSLPREWPGATLFTSYFTTERGPSMVLRLSRASSQVSFKRSSEQVTPKPGPSGILRRRHKIRHDLQSRGGQTPPLDSKGLGRERGIDIYNPGLPLYTTVALDF